MWLARSMAMAAVVGVAAASGGAAAGPILQAPKHCVASLSATGTLQIKRKHAKESARAEWNVQAALQYGSEYQSWSKAEDRSVACKKINGRYRCTARARPCRV